MRSLTVVNAPVEYLFRLRLRQIEELIPGIRPEILRSIFEAYDCIIVESFLRARDHNGLSRILNHIRKRRRRVRHGVRAKRGACGCAACGYPQTA